MLTNEKRLQLHFQTKNIIHKLSNELFINLSAPKKEIVILCIGTDRSTGDSLGPLVGTLLNKNYRLNYLTVYGSLHNPIHAKNLTDVIEDLNKKHKNSFFLAIDASLGRSTSIGHILFGKGPIQPGLALKKDLPHVGDFHITGIVNVAGFMNNFVLQSTRLSIVMSMAESIVKSLQLLDFKLSLHEQSVNN